jgi:hypothetical protein
MRYVHRLTVDTMDSFAMVEMTTLVAAVYRKYRTRVRKGMKDTSPGITSRFEVFYDEKKPRMKVSLSCRRCIVEDLC